MAAVMSSTDLLLRDLGYDTLSTIGEGTFSKIKLAKSKIYHCKVAIKVVDERILPASNTTIFLRRELDILKSICHPHVIHVFEVIEISNGLHFMVMELCSTDLLRLIQSTGKLTDEKSKCLFRQIICAIRHLHKHNVVHRDLKCENILLTENHFIKITDFGFGKRCSEETDLCTTYCGSVAYMSPEVLLNIPYDPKKYDIWSLGVILYIMVTGSFPFETSHVSKLPKIQQRGVVFPNNVDLDTKCKDLIKEMLSYSPEDRPDVSRVSNHDWFIQEITKSQSE